MACRDKPYRIRIDSHDDDDDILAQQPNQPPTIFVLRVLFIEFYYVGSRKRVCQSGEVDPMFRKVRTPFPFVPP